MIPGRFETLPAVADTPESRDIIIAEKSIDYSLKMAKNADLAIIGIGNAGENCSLVKAGFLNIVKRTRFSAPCVVAISMFWLLMKKPPAKLFNPLERISKAVTGHAGKAGVSFKCGWAILFAFLNDIYSNLRKIVHQKSQLWHIYCF